MNRLCLAACLVLVVLAAGCGSSGEKVPCIGKVTKLYTEQKAPTTVIVGGSNGSGGIGIPVGGGTRYFLYIRRGDGESCSRRVNKKTWLNKHEGETYLYVGSKG